LPEAVRVAAGWRQARQTGDLRLVQELMRHSSPATTAIYTEVADETRVAAIHALRFGGPAAPSTSEGAR